MKRWIVGGVAVLCAGAGVGLWLAKTESRNRSGQPETPSVAAAPPATPAAQVVLAEVVEVADIDLLLDPHVKDTNGVPFDADPPATVPISTPNVPGHIPPATDEPIVAPMPREVTAELPLFDPSRACWYGEHRLPRQIGGGLTQEEVLHQLRDTLWQLRPGVMPSGVDVGYGVFF